MNRTLKEATVHRYHYDSHQQLRRHLDDFVNAYNFGRRLKTLRGLTPYEFICSTWTSQPKRFNLNPLQQMPGLNSYSSLARLKELPFAEVKLDQSFVRNCGDDSTNAALCRTVVELAHRCGGSAVAEGIEHPSELAIIRHIGCDVGQGFLFAHAMPKEFLLTRLTAGDSGSFAGMNLDFQSTEQGGTRRLRA